MHCIVFSTPEGIVKVRNLVPGDATAIELLAIEAIAAAGLGPETTWQVIDKANLPQRRWRNAWRVNAGTVVADIVEARNLRKAELKAKRERLKAEAAAVKPLAEAAGDVATAFVADRNAAALQALDDAAMQASVDGVSDLATLDTYEPAAIANVGVLPTAQELIDGLRAKAKAILGSATDARAKKDRAIVSILLDEINDLRGWITSFKAATAAATNLADFKTRVAALSNTPARTMTQAKTKYETMVDSGKHDNGMVD